ncbi:nibrin [Battus philenor]|uniref:nibrin n=1 Tax=Battus philenor TaxID=42288 RepID=UPI0035D03E95
MWYLISASDPRVIYILQQKEVVIGRSANGQCCDFAVPEDPSISRKHASLSVSCNNLMLQDLGSKYGTFINNSSDKLDKNVRHKINNGDIIKFGKINCEWKAQYINFTTCTSTLKGENVQILKMNLEKLGGILKNEWDDSCVYLTMPAITLTVKVVLALVQGSYIVSIEFWNKCTEAVLNCTVLPDPKDYIPEVLEPSLNKDSVSFLPDNKRKALFAGKTVIFFSRKQLEIYKNVLSKSSGTAQLLSESKMTKSMLCGDNVIVIQYNLTSTSQETQLQRNQIDDIVNYLKTKNKRVVADAEIGLAILYCSLDKYCNPDFNFSTEVIKQTHDLNVKPVNILAQESEEPFTVCKKGKLIIDESLSSKIDCINASTSDYDGEKLKRKWIEEDDDVKNDNPNKKQALYSDTQESNSAKRPYEDDIDLNPAKKLAFESSLDCDDENFFKFTNCSVAKKDNTKKLNLLKPLKRKQDFVDNEENLFNFVENNPKTTKTMKKIVSNEVNLCQEQNTLTKDENDSNDKFQISTLRGIKLEELLQNNLKTEYRTNVNIKKEDISEIDGKLNDLDLGSTIIVLRSDLIVKKDPVQVTEKDYGIKNYKKFKKVWPVKREINITSKTSVPSQRCD